MPIAQLAALAICAILAGLGVFQVALSCGAPLGRLAWGGNHEVLPARLRIGSAVSVVLYALFAYVAIAAAGMAPPVVNNDVTTVSAWALTAYFTVGVVMNGMSRSKPERLIMTPTALVLATLYLLLSTS